MADILQMTEKIAAYKAFRINHSSCCYCILLRAKLISHSHYKLIINTRYKYIYVSLKQFYKKWIMTYMEIHGYVSVKLFWEEWYKVVPTVWRYTQKQSCHDANFIIIDGTTGCHYNSISWHHDSSLFQCTKLKIYKLKQPFVGLTRVNC